MLSKQKLRKFMPLFVTAILAAVIILPMWAGNTATTNSVAEIKTLDELKAAFEAGGEYKLVADISAAGDVVIEGYKNITLDLNGHKIAKTDVTASKAGEPARYFIRMRDGKLTLNNSDTNKEGVISASEKDGSIAAPRVVAAYPKSDAANAHPSVEINKGVTLKVKGTGTGVYGGGVQALGVFTDYTKSADEIKNTATAIVNEGAILDASECPENSTGKSITVEGYGTVVTINGGTFKGAKHFLGVYCGANVVVNNGTFTSDRKGLSVENAFVTIKDGTFTVPVNNNLMWAGMSLSDYPGAYDKGKIVVNNGTFTGTMEEGLDNYGNYTGSIEIYNGTFYNNPYFAVGSTDIDNTTANKWIVKNGIKEISDAYSLVNLLSGGGTFKLASDIELAQNCDAVLTRKDVVLDMNGHKISKESSLLRTDKTIKKDIFRVRDGTFTLNNSATTEAEIFGDAVENEFAVIRGFNVSPTWSSRDGGTNEGAAGSHPKLVVNSNVKIKVTGKPSNEKGMGSGMSRGIGVFTDDTPNTKDTIKCTATAEINGATVESGSNAVTSDGFGTSVTINGGTYVGGRHAISNNIGNTTVNDANATGGIRHTLYNCKGTLKVNRGTFKAGSDEKSTVLYNDADEDKYYKDIIADTTMTITGGSFVGAIKNFTDETQGNATITIEQGVFTVDPTEYVAKSSAVVKEGDLWLVKQTSGPSAPVIEGDVPKNVDTNPDTEAVKEEDVPVVFTESVETLGDGLVYVKTDVASSIVAKAFTSEKFAKVQPLPIFKATITEPGKVAAITTNIKGSDLLTIAEKVEDVDIRKLTSDSTALKFTRISNTEEAKDGTFIVLSSLGKVASGTIDANVVYQLVMFIQDNGNYDLDPALGALIDPSTLVKTETQSGGSSSGGGCNAGFGALALLMALPMFYRRKK